MTGKPRVAYPATWEERLDKIAEFHHKNVDGSGGTWGECNECNWAWPCPTYRWATELTGADCTWDLSECNCDSDHAALMAEANGEDPYSFWPGGTREQKRKHPGED